MQYDDGQSRCHADRQDFGGYRMNVDAEFDDETRRSGGDQFWQVVVARSGGELRSGGQNQFSAHQEAGQVREIAGVDPADWCVERSVAPIPGGLRAARAAPGSVESSAALTECKKSR